jgi:hypothetical protein
VGTAPPPGFQQGWTPVITTRRRSGWVTLIAVLLPILMTAGIFAFVFMKVDEATDQFNGTLESDEAESLGLDVEATTLFDTPALVAVTEVIDRSIPGTPTQFLSFNVFADYVVTDARDPERPANIDQYIWRGGSVGAPRPQTNRDEIDSLVFTLDEIDWTALGNVVAQAPGLTDVEAGSVDYISVQRWMGESIMINVYVNGPRDSAYISVSPAGEVLSVN